MGCLFTSPYSPLYYLSAARPASAQEQKPEEPKVYSWDVRRQIDPKDYMIENKNGETIVRLPGSINGMQFIIQNLENCNVYLFDNIAQISIDDCKNCKFFIGPSKGSLFIRDCNDCVLTTICQQFRTRDCKRITTFISCVTQPIIEASTYMKFACITVNYNQLNDQLRATNISPFNNNWNNIHDFTPQTEDSNYSFLNSNYKMEDFIPLPSEGSQINLSFSRNDTIVPYTTGISFRPNFEPCLIVLFVNDSNEIAAFEQESNANKIVLSVKNNCSDIVLVQTKRYRLSEHSAENVFGSKKYNNYLLNGPIIGLEFNGNDSSERCLRIVKSLNIDLVFVSSYAPELHQQIDNFYNFAEMQMSV